MAKAITESGMEFIADNVFHIEKTDVYAEIGDCIKTVEFIRANDNMLLFIEAKSSFPNPNNPKSEVEFQCQIDSLCDKFIHSLNLYASIAIGINGRLPSDFKPAPKASLRFILIFNNFEERWCIPVEKALRNQLSKSECIAKIWKPFVFVINGETAKAYNLIH